MIDHIKVADGTRGPITKQIQDAFYGIVKQKTEDKHNWLTFVD